MSIETAKTAGGKIVLRSGLAASAGFGWAMTTRRGWPDDPLSDSDSLRAELGGRWRTLAVGRQVHGKAVAEVGGREGVVRYPDTDGLFTREAGTALGIFTADCAAVVLYHPSAGALGAAHCGWRSLAADIPGVLIAEMERKCGARAGEMYAVISPCICGGCYEVGSEVALSVESACGAGIRRSLPDGKALLDIAAALAARLERAGVPPDRIETPDLCTACRADLFHSWRRERSKGRMITLAWRDE